MSRLLTNWFLFAAALVLSLSTVYAATTPTADVRLYALNCGNIIIHDGASFSDTKFYSHKPLHFVDPCFLIQHKNTWLLWDAGIGEKYLHRNVNLNQYGVTFSLSTSLIAQLKKLNLTPNDINYVGLSHAHFDHTGNMALFPRTTLLMQRAEYQSLEQKSLPTAVTKDLLFTLQPMSKVLLTGDYDVFGDGTVIILSTPGHTVGHQSLQLKLPKTGTVILSGDLYHLRSAYRHKQIPSFNASRADTLASRARVDGIIKTKHARLIIQHDPTDFAALPKFPNYLD